MGGKSESQVIGYWYGATMHCGIGLAMDELFRIEAGGKTAWSGSIKQNSTIGIAAPYLFGGIKAEGGIWGNLEVLFGKKDQGQSWFLTRLLGNNIPAFRGTATVVFDGWMCALNPYPKEWSFCYRRLSSGWPDDSPWYPEKISIWLANNNIQAMNPAHMLYESFISDTWGSGEPRSRMDDAAWQAAADTLYNENFGLCIEWKVTDEIKKFRDTICDHIGAKCDTDPKTGLITIRLIRDDYKIDELPTFDEDSGLLEISFDSTNNTEVPSQVIVKYTDAISFQECSVMAVNPAVAQGQFGRNTETTEYPAIPTGELATRVAYRDLKAKTTALKRCKVKLDRRGYELVNGQPFRIKTKYRTNNIDIVVRGERREEKFLTDGAITITALEDVFGLPKVAFNPTPSNPGQWQPAPPQVVSQSLLVEAPYRELSAVIDPANLQLLDDSSSFVFAIAKEPNSSCRSYDLLTRVKGASKFNRLDNTNAWCPMASIASPMGYMDTVIHITNGYLLEQLEIGTAAIIDNEIVRIDKVDLDNNQLTIGRGCADTVPATHNKGAGIWFYDTFEAIDAAEYSTGLTIEAKLMPSTVNAELAEAEAPIANITFKGRQARPYAPGNLKINKVAYPEQITDSAITVSWSYRNRLIQADQLIDTTVGDISPEANTTYNLAIYSGSTQVKNITGITANSYSFNASELGVSTKDSALLQFDDYIDPAGNIWTVQGNAQIVADSGAITGNCLQLDGNSYLTTPNTSSFNFDSNNFTLECWININTSDKYARHTILSTIVDNIAGQWQTYILNGYPEIVFPTGSGWESYQAKIDVADGKWHHIAYVRKDNYLKIYVDGVSQTNVPFTRTLNNNSKQLNIGMQTRNDGQTPFPFKGKIDQVRIAKTAFFSADFIPSREPYIFNDGNAVICRIALNSQRAGLTSYQAHDVSFRVE